jgi:hypothetical protein
LTGQSAATLQPHTPLTHAEPIVLPTQLTHVPPVEPHAVCAVPVVHEPPVAAVQQPPEHKLGPQVDEH